MNIRKFSDELQKIHHRMGETFSRYQAESSLTCPKSCGKCCQNPDIEVSTFEMIPLALRLLSENKLDEWYERIENSTQDQCLLYQPTSADGSQGKCMFYEERPSLCRMFGVAGFTNKHEKVVLSICKILKATYPGAIKEQEGKTSLEKTPLFSKWSYLMAELNPQLIQNRIPIKQALKQAIEKVALYAQCQDQ